MTQTIPLAAVPSQNFSITLGGQRCKFAIYQKTQGLFMDLSVDGAQVLTAMICRDRVSLVRYGYLGFVGALSFVDTQGASDPYYTGFSSRYDLVYVP
jgi:hypothetical protein